MPFYELSAVVVSRTRPLGEVSRQAATRALTAGARAPTIGRGDYFNLKEAQGIRETQHQIPSVAVPGIAGSRRRRTHAVQLPAIRDSP